MEKSFISVSCTCPGYLFTDLLTGSRSVQEAQILEGSESESDDEGPVYGGRSDDEGARNRVGTQSTLMNKKGIVGTILDLHVAWTA